MKTKKIFWVLSTVFGVLLLSVSQNLAQLLGPGEGQTKPGTQGPVITQSFAVEKGYYGSIWKIYLEAEDRDSDMLRIAAVVDQPGVGHYPTYWIVLRPEYQKHFKGYLQWNTFSSRAPYMPEWTPITLKVSILDKARNWSNEEVLPFTFETGVSGYKLPAPFDQGHPPKVGNVGIELYSPTSMGSGGARH